MAKKEKQAEEPLIGSVAILTRDRRNIAVKCENVSPLEAEMMLIKALEKLRER